MKQKFHSREDDRSSRHRRPKKNLQTEKMDRDGDRRHKMKPLARSKYRDEYYWDDQEE